MHTKAGPGKLASITTVIYRPSTPHTSAMRSPTSSPLASPTIAPSIWPLILTVLLIYLSQALYTLPINRVIEFRLCQEHYLRWDPSVILDDGSVPEKLCKIDDVQRSLAWLQGVMETTQVVGGTDFWRRERYGDGCVDCRANAARQIF